MAKKFDDYAADLIDLLAVAEQATSSKNRTKMESARADLESFIEESDDIIPGVIELDDVAANARRDMTLSILNGDVDDLASRTADVARLTKQFSDGARDNNSKAADIRLERVKQLSDAAITVISELKKFDEITDSTSPDGKKLSAAIQSAIDAVQNVQSRATA